VNTTPGTAAASAADARFVACHSIIQLDSRHPLAQKAVLDPQIMHRLVMSGFYGWTDPTEKDPRALMGILNTWTLDLRESRLVVVVQSRVQPDWSRIPRAALADRIETMHIDMAIKVGATYSFRVVVNPARDRDVIRDTPEGSKIVHARYADTTPHHVREWFAARLQPVGEPPVSEKGIRRIGADGKADAMLVKVLPKLSLTSKHSNARLGRAEIKGVLEVTDARVFSQCLSDGLGRAKAYSSGLLLIR